MSLDQTERQPLLADSRRQNNNNENLDSTAIENAEEEQKTPWYMVVLGVFLVCFAGFTFTGANVIQKVVCGGKLNFWSLFLIRALTQTPLMAGHIFLTKASFFGPKESRRILYCQGVFGGLLLLAIFVAIQHVPLGSASAIFFSTPVYTFIFATFMLKEPLKCYRVMIIIFMMSGVALITRPKFLGFAQDKVQKNTDNNEVLGYLTCCMVPILSAMTSIWTRQCKKLPASVVMFWFALGSCFWAIVGSLAFGQTSKLFDLKSDDIGYTMAIVFLGMLGNFSYTMAVKWVSPTKANVFRSFEVILNFLLQIFLEHATFHPLSIFGIFCLLMAVLATGFEKEVMKKKLHPWI